MNITFSEKTIHFKRPARTSRGEYTDHRMILIEMVDDEGHRGVGECAPLPDLSCDRNAYPNAAVAQQIFVQAQITGNVENALRNYPALLFAYESALAAMKRTPELYDTPFARGEEGIPINGLVWMGDYDEMFRQMQEKIDGGFKCVKLKIGAIDFERELDLIRNIRQSFSKEQIEIRVDANGGFSPSEVMNRLEQLARYDLHSIEQPVQPAWHPSQVVGGWQTMARICRESPLPIALDEELIGINDKEQKRELLDTIRPQYIVLKPTLHGGMAGTREWISLARERGIASWITSALESNIGLQSVALLAASEYGPGITFPQGLGTGQLFKDNIPMDIHIDNCILMMK